MAKNPKKGSSAKKTAAPAAEPVKSSEVVQLISAAKLKRLLNGDDDYKEQIGGITGELRQAIGDAVQHDHLHKGAYAKLKPWWKMRKKAEKLAHEWDVFMAYMDSSGLMKTIESVQQLPLGEGTGQEDEAGDADNVHQLQQAAE